MAPGDYSSAGEHKNVPLRRMLLLACVAARKNEHELGTRLERGAGETRLEPEERGRRDGRDLGRRDAMMVGI